MRFRILAQHPRTGTLRRFVYDNMTSALLDDETGSPVEIPPALRAKFSGTPFRHPPTAVRFSPDRPLFKSSGNLRRVLVKLGSACNLDCSYCRQRRPDHRVKLGSAKALRFLENLHTWFDGGNDGLGFGTQFELWGGEPLVYWKTLKPLAEGLRQRYPHTKLSIVTNGSLLDDDKAAWLERLGFIVAISHDGPGQAVRGNDPLQDPITRQAMLRLYRNLRPSNRISFNAVVNPRNPSRDAVRRFFIELTGDPQVPCGSGELVDPVGARGWGGFADPEEGFAFRRLALEEIRDGVFENFPRLANRISRFLKSVIYGVKADSITARCMVHHPAHISVDIDGNVTTCNNVDECEPAFSGRTHKLGTVEHLSDVRVDTLFHWSTRSQCGVCPMLFICKGGCPYLNGASHDAACESAYHDSVPIFAASIEWLTGCIPYSIDANHLPENRRNLFGSVRRDANPVQVRSHKRFAIFDNSGAQHRQPQIYRDTTQLS
jgi:uncharacterized protein